jgi:hypothetical protein
MDKVTAIGSLVIGLLLIACAGIIWYHMFRDHKAHSKWVTLLAAAGAIGVGIGVGALSRKIAALAAYSVGPIPVWIPVVVILGLIFVLQFMGNKDHHVRTPVIGILTALVLFVAIGHSVVSSVSGLTSNVKPQTQTASNVKPKG